MNKKIQYLIFIFIEVLFYLVITLDSFWGFFSVTTSSWIRYISILIYAIFSFLMLSKWPNVGNTIYLIASSACCLVADDFLLFEDELSFIGIIFFMIAALLYQYYATHSIKSISIQFAIGLIGMCVTSLFIDNTIESILAVGYILMCAYNIIIACIKFKKNREFKKYLFFMLGMILLFLCDINVGLDNVTNSFAIANILMWVFYLPSQICMHTQMYLDYKRSI